MLAIPAVFAACLTGGCETANHSLAARLQAEDPSVRIQAIHEAGETRNEKALPYLVDRLTDSEQDVRFYAILALERMTGQTLGYRYFDPAAERDEAAKRWRKWVRERRGGASTRPAGGEGSP
ncbi:MAG TPA: HEAT repeat domain-containing protein [Phycisphaerae bacterium]|nr:HEAT repeat domain-containing protein [Phycisphaerae bacterium]